jgi:hypothetical protein
MLQVFLEAVLVGVYTCIVFTIVKCFNLKNNNIELCIIGFLKHLLGFVLGLHSYYCNKGFACLNKKHKNEIWESASVNLFGESILEAIAFLLAGNIIRIFFQSKMILYFFIGFSLHLGAEIVYLHEWFCLNKCKKLKKNVL